jgi:hypothetical protein
MADLTQETIRFVTSLPLSINPYEALAEKAEKDFRVGSSHLPSPPAIEKVTVLT